MEDNRIIDLYWARSEEAVAQTARKYGGYCRRIAWNILYNPEDTDECVNDTYLRAWDTIPPQRPKVLQTFLARITRNLSLDRWRRNQAQKRDSGVFLALEELEACVPGCDGNMSEDIAIRDALNGFLGNLKPEHRKIFLRRYWYLSPVKEIAEDYSISESKVKMILLRTREKLRVHLETEGIGL